SSRRRGRASGDARVQHRAVFRGRGRARGSGRSLQARAVLVARTGPLVTFLAPAQVPSRRLLPQRYSNPRASGRGKHEGVFDAAVRCNNGPVCATVVVPIARLTIVT